MAGKTASETQVKGPQESAGSVADATNATPPSAGTDQVAQEQPVSQTPSLTPEQLEQLLSSDDVQARIYRQAQSMTDKAAHKADLVRQEEARKQRETQMDDEEYGRYVRDQTRLNEYTTALGQKSLGSVLTNIKTQALASIGDKALRAEMDAKADQYESLGDFVGACVKAEIERREAAKTPKREKELRDLITKEQMGEQAKDLVPQLGRGSPAARDTKLHGRERIAEALAEVRKEKTQKE